MSSAPFSAGPSALGYLYQSRVALWLALGRARAGRDFSVTLETLDDVVFESGESPLSAIQTKHRINNVADLGDGSADLWRTLRVWSSQTASGTLPSNAELMLLTTASARQGSATALLRAQNRNVEDAHGRLLRVAVSSPNASNAAGYAAFSALPSATQRALLERVVVIDGAPSISDLDGAIASELRFVAHPNHTAAVLQRMEGWWIGRVIAILMDRRVAPITSDDVAFAIDDLRESFRRDSLPIDEDILNQAIDGAAYGDAVFVGQLRLASLGSGHLLTAIRDYYRAYTQRSRWVRDELVLVGELNAYEKRLVDEWQIVFERLTERLPSDAAEEAKIEAAREVLTWAETSLPTIRPGVAHASLARGSAHMLADVLRIGWHRDFRARLGHLLGAETG